MFDNILVRYKGGSGGNTLGWFISQHLDSNVDHTHDARGRMIYVDQFNAAFVSPIPPCHIREKYALPNMPWKSMDHAIIGRFIRESRLTNPLVTTGVTGYHMPADFEVKSHFYHTFVIDLVPSSDNFWMVQAMQIYKDACRKMRWVDRNMDITTYPSKHAILEFFDTHGWYPAWWLWFEHEPIGSFEDFINGRGVITASHQLVLNGSDIVIEAGEFLTGRSLSSLHKICAHIGINSYKDDAVSAILLWIDKNINLLDTLDLSCYIGSQLAMRDQRQILLDAFLPRYDLLIKQDGN